MVALGIDSCNIESCSPAGTCTCNEAVSVFLACSSVIPSAMQASAMQQGTNRKTSRACCKCSDIALPVCRPGAKPHHAQKRGGKRRRGPKQSLMRRPAASLLTQKRPMRRRRLPWRMLAAWMRLMPVLQTSLAPRRAPRSLLLVGTRHIRSLTPHQSRHLLPSLSEQPRARRQRAKAARRLARRARRMTGRGHPQRMGIIGLPKANPCPGMKVHFICFSFAMD